MFSHSEDAQYCIRCSVFILCVNFETREQYKIGLAGHYHCSGRSIDRPAGRDFSRLSEGSILSPEGRDRQDKLIFRLKRCGSKTVGW